MYKPQLIICIISHHEQLIKLNILAINQNYFHIQAVSCYKSQLHGYFVELAHPHKNDYY